MGLIIAASKSLVSAGLHPRDSSSMHSYDESLDISSMEALERIEAHTLAAASLEHVLKETIIPNYHAWYNTFAPIHRFPTQVFGDVLLSALENSRTYLQDLGVVSMVAKPWRQVVLNTPALWAILDSDLPPRAVETFLQRSKAAPLSIHCYRAPPPEFVNTMKAHSERWATFVLSALKGYPADMPIKLLQAPLPILERLGVILPNESRAYFRLSGGRPLRKMYLHGISTDWDCSRLSGLRSLVLKEVAFKSPSELFGLLNACPALKLLDLALIKRSVDSDAELDHSPDALISLPKLESLHIESVRMPYLRPLLSHIDAPNCRNVSVEGHHLEGFLDSSIDPDNNAFRVMHHILNSGPSASAVLTSQGALEITGTRPEGDSRPPACFEFRPGSPMFGNPSPKPLLTLLTNMPTTSTTLHLTIESTVDAEVALFNLHQLPTLQTLKAFQREASLYVMKKLTSPPEGDEEWAFPALSLLHIEFEPYEEPEEAKEPVIAALVDLVDCGRWKTRPPPGDPNHKVLEVIIDTYGHTEPDSIEKVTLEAAALGILITLK